MPTFIVKHFPKKMKNFIKQDDLSRTYCDFTIYRKQNGWITKKIFEIIIKKFYQKHCPSEKTLLKILGKDC